MEEVTDGSSLVPLVDPPFDAVCNAVRRRLGLQWFRGKPRAMLRELVDKYGPERVAAAVRDLTPDDDPVRYVDTLQLELAPVLELEPPGHAPVPTISAYVVSAETDEALAALEHSPPPTPAALAAMRQRLRGDSSPDALDVLQSVTPSGHNGKKVLDEDGGST